MKREREKNQARERIIIIKNMYTRIRQKKHFLSSCDRDRLVVVVVVVSLLVHTSPPPLLSSPFIPVSISTPVVSCSPPPLPPLLYIFL